MANQGPGIRGHGRGSTGSAAVLVLALLVAGCASGSPTSFTSLPAADAQARAWVDTAIDASVPPDAPRRSNTPGKQSCTTSADFSEIPYEVVVDLPAADVDRATASVWRELQLAGFGTGDPPPTAPRAPGPGSPSWSLFLAHDGFQVEIVGSRQDPTSVRARIVTPCMRT